MADLKLTILSIVSPSRAKLRVVELLYRWFTALVSDNRGAHESVGSALEFRWEPTWRERHLQYSFRSRIGNRKSASVPGSHSRVEAGKSDTAAFVGTLYVGSLPSATRGWATLFGHIWIVELTGHQIPKIGDK